MAAAGCGATHSSSGTLTTPAARRSVTVYSSLPLQGAAGAEGQAIVTGIKLALVQARGRAGPWSVTYQSLDDSAGLDTAWDSGRVSANAQQAAGDADAVAYIGEAAPAATALSLPTLKGAGLAQVTPGPWPDLSGSSAGGARGGSTAAGGSGAAGGSTSSASGGGSTPSRASPPSGSSTSAGAATASTLSGSSPAGGSTLAGSSPAGGSTLLVLAPAPAAQAGADVRAMVRAGCRRIDVLRDPGSFAGAMVTQLREQSRAAGIRIAAVSALPTSASGVTAAVGSLRAGCAMIVADPSAVVTEVITALHNAASPPALFATSSICANPFPDPGASRTTPRPGWLVQCALPVPRLDATRAGRAFLAALRVGADTATAAAAVYGYEAMRLVLQAIATVPFSARETTTAANARRRAAVRAALEQASVPSSPLGPFTFDARGQSTLTAFTPYRVTAGGSLTVVAVVSARRPHRSRRR